MTLTLHISQGGGSLNSGSGEIFYEEVGGFYGTALAAGFAVNGVVAGGQGGKGCGGDAF